MPPEKTKIHFWILGAAGIMCLIVLLASAGFLIRLDGPGQQPAALAVQLPIREGDKPFFLDEFLAEEGFSYVIQDDEDVTYQQEIGGQLVTWRERVEVIYLIPQQPDLDVLATLGRFSRNLVADGYQVGLHQKEYDSGVEFVMEVRQRVPDTQAWVKVYTWHFFEQRPVVSARHWQVAEGAEGRLHFDPGSVPVAGRPRLAIVIDDWGYFSTAAEPLIKFPFPLTAAVLPYLPRSQQSAAEAAEAGHEVILHQPMEPQNGDQDPGEGAILTSMSEQQIRDQLLANLTHLSIVSGVNNHMGSLATTDPRVMRVVMETLREFDLFFLDSYTTAASVAAEVAKQVGTPYAVNRVFLDNVNEDEAIKQQLRKAIKIAKKQGQAVAIGHVRPGTARALWAMIPELVESGVELVPVSQILSFPSIAPAAETMPQYDELPL